MKATETNLQNILEGTKQFIVPLFQRTYSWGKKEWEILWEDLKELSEMGPERTHFIGSIVNIPSKSTPEGVSKFILIDGQQRLTTIMLLLALLKNKAQEEKNGDFADEINNTLLVNQYKKELNHFKLLPTQLDRKAFEAIVEKGTSNEDNNLEKAYKFFDKEYAAFKEECDPKKLDANEELKRIIINSFSMVSIVLDKDDNKYLVFESLNAKGSPLTPPDLIKNYCFMLIDEDKQKESYENYWQPMVNSLGNNLTNFIRHYLMKDGKVVTENDMYFEVKSVVKEKEKTEEEPALQYLKELNKYANYYKKLLSPEEEENEKVRNSIERINRIRQTTVYPLLLNIYNEYSEQKITIEGFVDILKTIENFLIRRFFCNIRASWLNKVFPRVYKEAKEWNAENIAESIKGVLQWHNYPNDSVFKSNITSSNIYTDRDTTRLILETLEEYISGKEKVKLNNFQIEHIMPQTLSEQWKTDLGENWEDIYDLLKNTIGNLTLTGYNPELSNKPFGEKLKIYSSNESITKLSNYFEEEGITCWTAKEINDRAKSLADELLEIWPNIRN